jgi:hypothetical protein
MLINAWLIYWLFFNAINNHSLKFECIVEFYRYQQQLYANISMYSVINPEFLMQVKSSQRHVSTINIIVRNLF